MDYIRLLHSKFAMKYAKQLQTTLNELPSVLQADCISYKLWKKFCKRYDNIEECFYQALALLKAQCMKVDLVYMRHYQRLSTKALHIGCVGMRVSEPSDILRFANINSQTVYKVAKRLGKVYKSPEPMRWLTDVRTHHLYAFMGGKTTTHLMLRVEGHVECPICMDDVEPDKRHKIVVFRCGHCACLDCVLRYAGVWEMKGTWFNLLACARKRDCPVCREKLALSDSICVQG